MKKIAIVDSGIDKDLFGEKIVEQIEFITNENDSMNNHGNLCCSAMLSVNENIEIYDIKILNEYNGCSMKLLLDALEYLSYKEIDIINLSLASDFIDYKDKFLSIIKKINSSGKIMVASQFNNNQVSFPASLDGVIGVTGNTFIKNTSFWYNMNLDIQCVADKKPILLKTEKNSYEMFGGNSKATAVFSGLLGKYMDYSERNDYEAMQKILMKKAEKNKWNQINEETIYFKNKKSNKKIIKELVDIVRDTLMLDLSDQEILNAKEKYIPGINRLNAFLLIKNLEERLKIHIDYSAVDVFWFLSIMNLYTMLERNSNIDYVNKTL